MYDFVIQVKILYLEYSRSKKYKKVFPLLFLCTLMFIPDSNDYTNGMIFGRDYRGYFNSHWAGTSFAVIYIILAGLFGYYIISDRGNVLNNYPVNRLIGSTRIDKKTFVLSVFCSKFLILLTTVIPIIIVAFASILIKKESSGINIIHLCMPFITFAIPALFLIVSITFFFDSIEWLSGVSGSLIYFILYIVILTIEVQSRRSFLFGISDITYQITLSLSNVIGRSVTGYTLIGNGYVVNRFLFEGITYSWNIFINRLITIFTGIALIKFAVSNYQFYNNSSVSNSADEENDAKVNRLFGKINNLLMRVGLYECILYLSDIKAWKVIVLIFFMALSLVSYSTTIYTILFFIPMGIISKLMLYGSETNLSKLMKSTEYYHKQIYIAWLSGIIILLFVNSLVLIKYLITGDYMAINAVMAGCFIISASSILIGEITRNENIFQIIYLLLIYIMMDGEIYVVDFTGRNAGLWNYKLVAMYIVTSIVIICMLTVRRKLLTRANWGDRYEYFMQQCYKKIWRHCGFR